MARCCDHHADWPTLAQHIVDDFPEAPLGDVARELRVARLAVETVDVGDDALDIAERIARFRLLVATGAITKVAR